MWELFPSVKILLCLDRTWETIKTLAIIIETVEVRVLQVPFDGSRLMTFNKDYKLWYKYLLVISIKNIDMNLAAIRDSLGQLPHWGLII